MTRCCPRRTRHERREAAVLPTSGRRRPQGRDRAALTGRRTAFRGSADRTRGTGITPTPSARIVAVTRSQPGREVRPSAGIDPQRSVRFPSPSVGIRTSSPARGSGDAAGRARPISSATEGADTTAPDMPDEDLAQGADTDRPAPVALVVKTGTPVSVSRLAIVHNNDETTAAEPGTERVRGDSISSPSSRKTRHRRIGGLARTWSPHGAFVWF